MGNFYVNFSIKGVEQQQVVNALRRAGRKAIVTPPQNGYVVAYDEEADLQGIEPILTVGSLLSREVGGVVLAVLNHDDDLLCYWLFAGGELTDSYNSRPDYFGEVGLTEQGGDATRLCTLLGVDSASAVVETILRGDSLFAVDQHLQLAQALGLPSWSIGLGYNYVADCELEDELDLSQLVHVGRIMSTRLVQLVDQSRAVLATAQVADKGSYFGGTIDLRSTPAHLRSLFEEFEEIINGQMFAFLDENQEKINSLPIKAVFEDGSEVRVKDLQVFPSSGDVSFRLAGVPSQSVKPA